MKRYIDGAALETRQTDHPFPYPYPRAFQEKYLNWLHNEDDDRIAVLQAPTGAGKTAAFTELIKQSEQTLIVYPTNALMEQQREILEETQGVNVFVLNADTIERHGRERGQEILAHANPNRGANAIVTNPDILQAIIQDQYVDYNAEMMRFFDRFDGVVYDEFHFYDEFAASGLLLQLKIFRERRPDANITLASATPRDDYLEFLNEKMNVRIHRIQAEYVPIENSNSDQFRHAITLKREKDSIWEMREHVAETLEQLLADACDLTEPRIALIFNSAYESNRFHEYLSENHKTLFDNTEKDNGYETKSDVEIDDNFYILNTTSKGEVGLNYDIKHLHMDVPQKASQFIQRIGRAGRKNNATVHIHGVGELSWEEEMSYEKFIEQIWNSFIDPDADQSRLESLVAIRSAYALWSRERTQNFNRELLQDFKTVDEYGRWRRFIEAVVEASEEEYDDIFGPQPSTKTLNLIQFTRTALDSLSTLRGRTVSHNVKYPRGDRVVETEYGLLSALRRHSVSSVQNGRITLEPEDTVQNLRIKYVGLSNSLDASKYPNEHVNDIQDSFEQLIQSNEDNIETVVGVNPELFYEFVFILGVRYASFPREIKTGDYVFECSPKNGTISIDFST